MKRRSPPAKKREAGLLQALQQGLQHHQQGRLDQAEYHYKGILAAQPNHFGAKHLLGVVLYQQGRNQEAFDYIKAALKLNHRACRKAATRLALVASEHRRLLCPVCSIRIESD